ncbi:MAG TPA: secondary thiamine-phosphate synthase enzyme YjbQ [Verrucomicrobiae bacterium]|nr:secondary thiamine-phosphate synthase enzyme YjbQ [Verrucomicrobiae bacterium]
MKELLIRTDRHATFIEITEQVQQVVDGSGMKEGVCMCFVPHTTAGITINENADPDVVADILYALDKAVPWKDSHYQHGEGNTAAHVKASMMGHSVHVLIRGGKLQFGTWQGIYFCEFDGPRSRKVWVTVQSHQSV